MGDVDYMISKLRGTAGSSVGTGAVVVVKSNSNARKVALRYPSPGVVVGRILVQVAIFALVVFCGMSIALRGGRSTSGERPLRVVRVLGCCVLCGDVLARVGWPSARERARCCNRNQPAERAAARRTRRADGDGRTWGII